MTSLVLLFVECSLQIVEAHNPSSQKNGELVRIIETLDLSAANLGVALVFLEKYKMNSVNRLDVVDCPAMQYYAIMASLILANKFLNDLSYTLKTWHSIISRCSLFQASLALLNQLEVNFLCAVDYALSTAHSPDLWRKLDHLGPGVAQMRGAVDPDFHPELLDTSSCATSVLATPPMHALPSLLYSLNSSPHNFTFSPHSVSPPFTFDSPWRANKRRKRTAPAWHEAPFVYQ